MCISDNSENRSCVVVDITKEVNLPILPVAQEYEVCTSMNSDQEEPFEDSGSSYTPSENDVHSERSFSSSDDLPLAKFIKNNSETRLKPAAKRAKKGCANPLKWQVNKTKLLRMKGHEYQSFKKEIGGQKSLVKREHRKIGKRCESKKCAQSKSKRQCSLISEEDRQVLFKRFW